MTDREGTGVFVRAEGRDRATVSRNVNVSDVRQVGWVRSDT